MAKNKGLDGFDYVNPVFSDQIKNSKVSTQKLATVHSDIFKGITKLDKTLRAMPVELYEVIGADLLISLAKIQDLAGSVGEAHDLRIEGK